MSKHSLSIPLPAPATRRAVPLFSPLRHARYRQLWIANLISNLGTWTQTFACAWLIASMAHSASITTLVQTASYAPIFLFALFAGVIADTVHRPKFLFFCNLCMALCACLMAALVLSGRASAGPVLAITFCLGVGSAFVWPAWQASMCGLVEPDEVCAAATLNNLSYNLAAILGPALGGVLFHWVGPGGLFLANAVSFVGLLGAYLSWWRETSPTPAPATAFARSLENGLRAAFGCQRYRRILRNVCTVFFATIVFAGLLPVYVRDVLRLDSGVFGVLMGSLGAGAVVAAFFLPALRARFATMRLLAGALMVYAMMLLTMAGCRSLAVLVPVIVCGGMAWSVTVSILNGAAQSSFPLNIRARTLSIYLFVMAGGYVAGSVFWGAFADRFGVSAAFAAAGACVLVNAAALATGKPENAI
jgi:MFS family permease